MRLYAVIREDLNMSPGKLSAQAGHAFLDSYLETEKINPKRAEEYRNDGHGTKVTLVAPTQDAILLANDLCDYEGIPHRLIIDSGHIMPPHFDGNPIITALGIGPCRKDEVQKVTKHFKLA